MYKHYSTRHFLEMLVFHAFEALEDKIERSPEATDEHAIYVESIIDLLASAFQSFAAKPNCSSYEELMTRSGLPHVLVEFMKEKYSLRGTAAFYERPPIPNAKNIVDNLLK